MGFTRPVSTVETNLFGKNWDVSSVFHSTKMGKTFVGPAKRSVFEILRCIDSQIRGVSGQGEGAAVRRAECEMGNKKCVEICQIRTQTGQDLNRADSLSCEGQGSPWAIHAVHGLDSWEEGSATDQEDLDVLGVDGGGAPMGAGFTTVDNPVFDFLTEERSDDYTDVEFGDGPEVFSVWENPAFSAFEDYAEETELETEGPGTSFMSANPLFEEGFAAIDKGATDISNPLYECAAELGSWESDDERDCSAYNYSLLDIKAWGDQSPSSHINYDEGLFDSAADYVGDLAGAWGTANSQHLILEDGGASCKRTDLGLKDGKEVDSRPQAPSFCSENLACEFGQDFISFGTCRRRNVGHGSTRCSYTQVVTAENSQDSRKNCVSADSAQKENSKRCRGNCGTTMGTSIANLSAKLCGKVVWLFGYFLSVCNNCIPVCDELFFWETANEIGL